MIYNSVKTGLSNIRLRNFYKMVTLSCIYTYLGGRKHLSSVGTAYHWYACRHPMTGICTKYSYTELWKKEQVDNQFSSSKNTTINTDYM